MWLVLVAAAFHPTIHHQCYISAAHRPFRTIAQRPFRTIAPRLEATAKPNNEPIQGPRVVTNNFTLRVSAALFAIVGVFSAAFALVEKWSPLDAIYYTTTTMATIGFGDLRPVTAAGRTITSLLACLGVGLLGGLVSAVVGEYMRPPGTRLDARDAAEDAQCEEDEECEVETMSGPLLRWAQAWTQQPLSSRPWVRAAWVQVAILLSIGTFGFKACEQGATTWAKAVYLIWGSMTTAGLGECRAYTCGPELTPAALSLSGLSCHAQESAVATAEGRAFDSHLLQATRCPRRRPPRSSLASTRRSPCARSQGS